MSDFEDRPFVAGSLIGERSFGIDQYGRLTGVSYRKVWTPLDNTAECFKSEAFGIFNMGSMFAQLYATPPTFITNIVAAPESTAGTVTVPIHKPEAVEPEPAPVVAEKPKHSPGSVDCACGYYAYFDGEKNPYHGPERGGLIRGIVEGFGIVTVGSRGFRAEKARIKALVIPTKKADRAQFQLVRRNYPDIPVFESKALALDTFALTPPPLPSPATHGDFWTKEKLS